MLFKFAREAGEKLREGVGGLADTLKSRIENRNADVKNLKVQQDGERIILEGNAPTRAAAEKAIVDAGNTPGIGEVESRIDIEAEPDQTNFYTVQSGDTLSKIALAFYGDANKYPVIFEANTPMLEDPDKIYPGQTLRIPTAAA